MGSTLPLMRSLQPAPTASTRSPATGGPEYLLEGANALDEGMRDETATKELVRAELANLRYQMLGAHLASFIGLALLILFRT
jgi:hypothetical protein